MMVILYNINIKDKNMQISCRNRSAAKIQYLIQLQDLYLITPLNISNKCLIMCYVIYTSML